MNIEQQKLAIERIREAWPEAKMIRIDGPSAEWRQTNVGGDLRLLSTKEDQLTVVVLVRGESERIFEGPDAVEQAIVAGKGRQRK